MEQQLDAFTQKRFELMVEMATKKLQQEIDSLKVAFNSLNGELNSMKSQVSRMQFQPQEQPHHVSRPAAEESQPAGRRARQECGGAVLLQGSEKVFHQRDRHVRAVPRHGQSEHSGQERV